LINGSFAVVDAPVATVTSGRKNT